MSDILMGRKRLSSINDALYSFVKEGMSELGWLTPAKSRENVQLINEPVDYSVEIKPNIVSVTIEDSIDDRVELGSLLSEEMWDCYIDIFAENQAVGQGLVADLAALLRGKFASLGLDGTRLSVNDYRTDEFAFSCEIENVVIERQRNSDRKYQRYWWIIGFDLIDTYNSDLDEESI